MGEIIGFVSELGIMGSYQFCVTVKGRVALSTTAYILPSASVAMPVNSTSQLPFDRPYLTSSVPLVLVEKME